MTERYYTFTGLLLFLSTSLRTVASQAKYVDSLDNLKTTLDKDTYRSLVWNYTLQFFSPHDSSLQDDSSIFFLLQSNLPNELHYTSKFSLPSPIEYKTFDFFADSGPKDDGDNFIAKVQRVDIEMLGNMKRKFYTTRAKKVQGFNVGRQVMSRTRGDPMEASKKHLELMLTKVFTFPRNHRFDIASKSKLKENIGSYIWRKLGSFGFLTGAQTFKPRQFLHIHGGSSKAPPGTNLIGIFPGQLWGKSEDQIVVVGAHWDTVQNTGGLDDNGSGMAAMLELARALNHGKCSAKYSIILVAFDLEEFGSQGSLVFVQDFLIAKVIEAGGFPHFRGAIIMDSILHHNMTSGSQTVEQEWEELVPGAVRDIRANNRRGDFLAVMKRAMPADTVLAETFSNNWIENNPIKTIRLVDFQMENLNMERANFSLLVDHVNFLRSDHARFWSANNKNYFASLPAIVLTDTGPYRGGMTECYHGPCDIYNPRKKNSINWTFFLHTTQTLIDTVVELSESRCKTKRSYQFASNEVDNAVFIERNNVKLNDFNEEKAKTSPNRTITPEISTNKTIPLLTDKPIMSEKSEISNLVFNHKARLNDKTLSEFSTSKESTSLLAYTGDNHISQVSSSSTSNRRADIIKYKLNPLYPLPHTYLPQAQSSLMFSPNLFYAGTNRDNPFFTRITLPRVPYQRLVPVCHPFCHIGRIVRQNGGWSVRQGGGKIVTGRTARMDQDWQ